MDTEKKELNVNLVINSGRWVGEQQLMDLKGIKKGTLKKARECSFMEGREYKHVSFDGEPWDNSPCFYNIEEIDKLIEGQKMAKSRVYRK